MAAPKPKCGSRLNKREGTCTLPAGWGTPHPGAGRCRFHGGNTPNHIASAVASRIKTDMATYGQRRDITASAALLEEIQWSAGHVEWLRGKVAELDPAAITWGVSEIADRQASEFPGTDTIERAALSVWLEAYHRERRYFVDVCKAALSAGCEERMVRAYEAYGTQLAGVVITILGKLNLTEEQRRTAGQVVPEALRMLGSPTIST